MIFFQRLFAAYYLLLIRLRASKTLRHMNRGGTEDFGAVCLVICSQMFLILLLVTGIRKVIGFKTSLLVNKEINFSKIAALILVGILLYIGNRYFVSNRERRNKFIDSLKELDKTKKNIWIGIALLMILIPLFVIVFIF